MNKETTETKKAQEVPSENKNELSAIAKCYHLINILILLFLCLIITFFFISGVVGKSPLILVFPLSFALLNIILIIATAYLGTKVANMGWISSLFLSFFGNLIVAIIFIRLAANRLKENGYRVGLIKCNLHTRF